MGANIFENALNKLKGDYTTEGINSFMDFVRGTNLQKVIENARFIFSEPTKGADFIDNVIRTNEIPTSSLFILKEQLDAFISKAQSGGYDNTAHLQVLSESSRYLDKVLLERDTVQYLREDTIYNIHHQNLPHSIMTESILHDVLDQNVFNIGQVPTALVNYAANLKGLSKFEDYMRNDPGVTLVKNTSMVLNLPQPSTSQIEADAIDSISSWPHIFVDNMINSKEMTHSIATDLKGIIHKQLERTRIGIDRGEGNQAAINQYHNSLIKAEEKLLKYRQSRFTALSESMGDYITLNSNGTLRPNGDFSIDEIELDNILSMATPDETEDEHQASDHHLVLGEASQKIATESFAVLAGVGVGIILIDAIVKIGFLAAVIYGGVKVTKLALISSKNQIRAENPKIAAAWNEMELIARQKDDINSGDKKVLREIDRHVVNALKLLKDVASSGHKGSYDKIYLATGINADIAKLTEYKKLIDSHMTASELTIKNTTPVNESALLSVAVIAAGAIAGVLAGQKISLFLLSLKDPEFKEVLGQTLKVTGRYGRSYSVSNKPDVIRKGISELEDTLKALENAKKLTPKGNYAQVYHSKGLLADINTVKSFINNLNLKLEKLESSSALKEYFDPTVIQKEYSIAFVKTFMDDSESLNLESFMQMMELAHRFDTVVEENVLHNAARNVSLGAEKVTRGINHAAKRAETEGKRVSVVAKRVPQHIDRLTDNTIGSLMKMDRNERRKRIIEGGYKPRLFKIIRNGILIGGAAAVSPALAAVALVAGIATNKTLDNKVRAQIVDEFEAELRIVKEKIEDAKAANDKQKKYQLMRIHDKLERDIVRIRYNIKDME